MEFSIGKNLRANKDTVQDWNNIRNYLTPIKPEREEAEHGKKKTVLEKIL